MEEKLSRSMARRYEVQGNMVLIPKEELEGLERALMHAWDHACYVGSKHTEMIDGVTTSYLKTFDSYEELFADLGFIEREHGRYDMHKLTPKAHAFASRMTAREKK